MRWPGNIPAIRSSQTGSSVSLFRLQIPSDCITTRYGRTERDCTVKCARILRALLATKADQKNISYELISRKSDNNSYSSFTELYRDLRIAAMPVEKRGLLVRIKSFFHRNADLLFGILFWVCLILGIVALILLLSHVVWGNVPIIRWFINTFKIIGTESMLQ